MTRLLKRIWFWVRRPFRSFYLWRHPEIIEDIMSVCTAVIGVALIAVIVSKSSNTRKTIIASEKAFRTIRKTAEGKVK